MGIRCRVLLLCELMVGGCRRVPHARLRNAPESESLLRKTEHMYVGKCNPLQKVVVVLWFTVFLKQTP